MSVNTIAEIVVLLPMMLGFWLGVRAIHRSGSQLARLALIIVIILVMVNSRIGIAMERVNPVAFLIAGMLTASILVLHKRFG